VGETARMDSMEFQKQIRLQKIKMHLEKFMRMGSGTRIGLHGAGRAR